MTDNLPSAPTGNSISIFSNATVFAAAEHMSKCLAASTIVPKLYQENPANCMIALELSARLMASPIMVMQNLYIVKGKPAFGAKFVIAAINGCGRFLPLRFEEDGDLEGDGAYRCRAYTTDLRTKEVLKGSWITWDMVNGEGWFNNPGSKWKTMPEQMFRYRAASFWERVHAPELTMGMQTSEEIRDIVDTDATVRRAVPASLTEALGLSPPPNEESPPFPETAGEPSLAETAFAAVSHHAKVNNLSRTEEATLRGKVASLERAGNSFDDAFQMATA